MLKKVPNFAVYDAGLPVHPSFPFTGATPDGKVYDPSENPPYGLLEINCPFSKRKDTLVQASGDGTFYLEERENSFYLKRNHTCGYFVQIQGQLGITGLNWCDFCVYLSESNEMSVERIYFNEDFWANNLLPKLSDFFLKQALPCLASD